MIEQLNNHASPRYFYLTNHILLAQYIKRLKEKSIYSGFLHVILYKQVIHTNYFQNPSFYIVQNLFFFQDFVLKNESSHRDLLVKYLFGGGIPSWKMLCYDKTKKVS